MIVKGKCKHFNGTQHKQCKAGVSYDTVHLKHEPMVCGHGHAISGSLPCHEKWNPGGATCEKRELPSQEEVAEQEREDERHDDLMRRGLTSCCEAPIDKSQVIVAGPHKGHGPRYCTKCGRCVFIV